MAGRFRGKGTKNYGRVARGDEYSPGVPIPGRQSRHFVQVRWRTEDSSLQAWQPLALQEIEAGSVDGREVERNGAGGEAETKGRRQRRWAALAKTRGPELVEGDRATKKVGTCLDLDRSPLLVWMWAPRASRRWS